jgi:hypothetical protein
MTACAASAEGAIKHRHAIPTLAWSAHARCAHPHQRARGLRLAWIAPHDNAPLASRPLNLAGGEAGFGERRAKSRGSSAAGLRSTVVAPRQHAEASTVPPCPLRTSASCTMIRPPGSSACLPSRDRNLRRSSVQSWNVSAHPSLARVPTRNSAERNQPVTASDHPSIGTIVADPSTSLSGPSARE